VWNVVLAMKRARGRRLPLAVRLVQNATVRWGRTAVGIRLRGPKRELVPSAERRAAGKEC